MSFFDLYKWAVVPLIRRLGGHVPGEPAAPPPSQHHQHSRACVSAAPDSPLSLGLCAIPAPQSGLGTAGPTRGHLSQPKTRTCFKQDVTRSDVKGAGEVSSSSFFLLFFCPQFCAPRWGRNAEVGRAGGKESVWCGSGTFCLVRGQAQELLVSFQTRVRTNVAM